MYNNKMNICELPTQLKELLMLLKLPTCLPLHSLLSSQFSIIQCLSLP